MKGLRRAFSMLLIVCLCVTLLPMTFVSADDSAYVTRAEAIPEGFVGHVVTYNVVDESQGLIRLDVGVSGLTMQGNAWFSGIQFDPSVLTLCKPDGGDITLNRWGNAVEMGMVTQEMSSDIYAAAPTTSLIDSDLGLFASTFTPDVTNNTSGKVYRGFFLNTTALVNTAEYYPGVTRIDDAFTYKFPKEHTKLYSVYLRLQSGKTLTDVKSTTIQMAINDRDQLNEAPNGSMVLLGAEEVNEKTCMVGFPEASYEARFAVTDSNDSALDDATVTVYKSGETSAYKTLTTADGGAASVSLPNGTYDYVVSKDGYASSTKADFTVANAVVTIPTVKLTKQTSTYPVKWTFSDASDNAKLEKVEIVVTDMARSATTSYTTNSSGIAEASLADGSYTYTASLSGYDSLAEQHFTVNGVGQSFNHTLSKSAVPKYNYTIKVTDTDSKPLEGAAVTVYDAAGTKKVAAQDTDAAGEAVFSLEAGDYQYTVSKGIWFVGTAMKAFRVSSAAAGNNESVQLTPVDASKNPKYVVRGAYDDASGKYKVDVTVANVAAVGASFGLKYDSKIFTLDTDAIKYNTTDIVIAQPHDQNPGAGFAPQQTAPGYVTFGWYANNGDYVLDATTEEKALVSYTFTPNEGWEDWVDSETFQVMPWTDTAQGGGAEALIADIWNVTTNKYRGLALPKDAGGSYMDADGVDLDMEFIYDDQDRYRLTFQVIEEDVSPEKGIAGATIDLYSAAAMDTNLGPITADENGIAEIVVDQGTYKYMGSATGYWSNPESEETADYNTTEEIKAPAAITVPLRAKTYREVTVAVTNGTITSGSQTVTDTNTDDADAETAVWENQAVEGVDLYFITFPAAGYIMDGAPQYTIGETGTAVDASFDKVKNQWYVPGTAITDKVALNVSYKVGSFTVTANINAGGTMTWNGVPETDTPATKSYNIGQSSGDLVFTADTGNVIHQVVINGSDYPIAANATAFTYAFNDIKENHTITVLFQAETAEHPEEYVVSVLAGEYGKIDVSYDTVTETLTGEGAKDYIVPWGTNFTATAAPTDSSVYEIDNVIVGGTEETISDRTAHMVTLTANADSQNVVATFRAKDTDESFQYWIYTEIVGMGSVDPFGSRLYYAYEKPAFTFTPEKLWRTESIVITGADGSVDNKGVISAYTFETLTQDVTITATYVEIVQEITGAVNYAQGTSLENGLITPTMPKVVFERESDGKTFEADFSVSTAAITGETTSPFTAKLPAGTYTITATKHGHLDYAITDFVVTIDEAAKADVEKPGAVEGTIVMTPGNTNSDTYITFFDILRMVNGFARYGDGSADVDETGDVAVEDLNYAKANYAEEAVNVTYEAHKTKAGQASS